MRLTIRVFEFFLFSGNFSSLTCDLDSLSYSGVTRGLSQGGQSLAEGGSLAKSQKKVKK